MTVLVQESWVLTGHTRILVDLHVTSNPAVCAFVIIIIIGNHVTMNTSCIVHVHAWMHGSQFFGCNAVKYKAKSGETKMLRKWRKLIHSHNYTYGPCDPFIAGIAALCSFIWSRSAGACLLFINPSIVYEPALVYQDGACILCLSSKLEPPNNWCSFFTAKASQQDSIPPYLHSIIFH